MRPAPNDKLERFRLMGVELEMSRFSPIGTNCGVFAVGYKGTALRIIASDGLAECDQGWEHVSVSVQRRLPSWEEMCFVKDLFWQPEECVMQLHPPQSEWINNHPFCLHLWRSRTLEIPRPPAVLVGTRGLSYRDVAKLKSSFTLDPQRSAKVLSRRRGV